MRTMWPLCYERIYLPDFFVPTQRSSPASSSGFSKPIVPCNEIPMALRSCTAAHCGYSHTWKISPTGIRSTNRVGAGECRTPRSTRGGSGDGGL